MAEIKPSQLATDFRDTTPRSLAPGVTSRMTGPAVIFVTPGTGSETLSAENMETVVADVMTLARVEAGFTGEGVEAFQYGVECQRKWPRILSPLH